ncbi:MAG: hypothetical protein LBK61_13265 [Spirochaetaceae bacterium]|jgi:hypothetical protein|nr:hypothetical protein [Spirochaetaceae bacterium]
MKLNDAIKGVFESEVERYREHIPRLKMPVNRQNVDKKHAHNSLANIMVMLCIVAFCVMAKPMKTDPRLRSTLAKQGEYIAQLIPEDPVAVLYDFVKVINSSYEE